MSSEYGFDVSTFIESDTEPNPPTELVLHPVDARGGWPKEIIRIQSPRGKPVSEFYPGGKIPKATHSESERIDALLSMIANHFATINNTNPEEELARLKDKIKGDVDIKFPRSVWEAFLSEARFSATPQTV